jgi:hypothetical protein
LSDVRLVTGAQPTVSSFDVKNKSESGTNRSFGACRLSEYGDVELMEQRKRKGVENYPAETKFIRYALSRDLFGLPGWGG